MGTPSGQSATGTATITDDGTGTLFNPNGTENPGAAKDDDRDLTPPSAPQVTIVEDANNDGWINLAEMSGPADVVVALPSDALAGDVLRVTDGATVQEFTLTPQQIAAGTVPTTFPMPSEGGLLTVSAYLTDEAGNVGSAGTDLARRDTLAPTVAITAIADDTALPGDFATSDRTLVFSGTATAGLPVTLTLDGTVIGTAVADASGRWTFDHTGAALASGTRTLQARVVDPAGNSGSASREVVILAAALDPDFDDGASNQDLITSVTTPEFTLQAAGLLTVGDVVQLRDPQGRVVGSVVVTAQDVAAGTVNVPSTQLDDGSYQFTAQVVNASGQVKGEVPVGVTVITDLDGIAPSVELAVNGGDSNGDGIPDWQQNNVAQFPIRSAAEFQAGTQAPAASFGAILVGDVASRADVPVELNPEAQLQGIQVRDLPASLPVGFIPATPLIQFTVTGREGEALDDLDPSRPGLQTRVVIELPEGGVLANTYVKWDAASASYYEFLDDGRLDTYDNGATLLDLDADGRIDRVVLTLTDGQRGDLDGLANGSILDPGLLALKAQPIYGVGSGAADRWLSGDLDAARQQGAAKNAPVSIDFYVLPTATPDTVPVAAWVNVLTGDYFYAPVGTALPYACYVPMAAQGLGHALAVGTGAFDVHLFINSQGVTHLVGLEQAKSMGLSSKGFTDLGALFASALPLDPNPVTEEIELVGVQGNGDGG